MYCDYNEFMLKLKALETKYILTNVSNESDRRIANMYKDTISMFELHQSYPKKNQKYL